MIVTHGIWDDATSDPNWQTLARDIANKLAKPGETVTYVPGPSTGHYEVGDTIVTAYDWGNIAQAPETTPENVKGKAEEVGRAMGRRLISMGYENIEHIHFIAHSAGAALINEAAHTLLAGRSAGTSPTIQTTFLDPYIGATFSGSGQYGAYSDWADNYFARDLLTNAFTANQHANAHNVDVTWLDPQAAQKGFSTHGFPVTFYTDSVAGQADGYGYTLNMEGGSWTASQLKATHQENNVPIQLGSPPPLPNITTPMTINRPVDIGSLLKDANHMQTSSTGRVGFIGGGINLSSTPATIHPLIAQKLAAPLLAPPAAQGELDLGPAWMAILVPVNDLSNVISFEAEFTSAAGAEGLLSVYWDGDLIATIDERYALSGVQSYSYPLPGTFDGSEFTLAFRLDSYGSVTSSVSIENVSVGYYGQPVPEPSGLALAATSVLVAMRRRRAA